MLAMITIWFIVFVRGKYLLEHIFLFFAVTYGLAYMFAMPAFSAPDELAHFITSYRISNNLVGGINDNDEKYVMCREIDALKREMMHVTTLETYRYIKIFNTSHKISTK